MMNTPDLPLTLYIDLACPLCAREAHWLARHADPARLRLVDISAVDFDEQRAGRSRQELGDRLHARSASGQWYTGVDATLWSWRAAGLYRWAAPLAWRPLRPLFKFGYSLFRRLRPHLAWLPHPDGSRRCAGQCELPPSPHDKP
ncbi:putative DCC family thiol-disulfide oxidoreductase YuxK [Pseudomonas sp. SLBN-26]|nr:putative DCC family thiol-disulfide oxidoreductase YuxK [Pseudomonas otitidis]TQL04982.1 putative DCC family thiol-disulfide oxidoreductase YuxK [Pseudomonas sp. SLBN-26]